MTVISIRRRPGCGATIGSQGERGFSRAYRIKSSIPDEVRSVILAQPLLPKYGAPHPEDPTCTCSDIDLVQLEEDPTQWLLHAKWSTLHSKKRDETEDQKQPDKRRPRWSKRFTPIPNYLPKDLDGKLFCDRAGSPFDPPPEMPIWVQEVTVVRYEANWDDPRDLSYIYATNTDVWWDSVPGTALIGDITCQEVWLDGAYWYEYTWKILQNPKITLSDGSVIGGWDPLLVINAGPKYYKTVGGVKQRISATDDDGAIDGRAVYLDNNGFRLAPNTDGSYTPVLLQFRVKNKQAFAPLNLVPPFLS